MLRDIWFSYKGKPPPINATVYRKGPTTVGRSGTRAVGVAIAVDPRRRLVIVKFGGGDPDVALRFTDEGEARMEVSK
jgi:hypothetical protein